MILYLDPIFENETALEEINAMDAVLPRWTVDANRDIRIARNGGHEWETLYIRRIPISDEQDIWIGYLRMGEYVIFSHLIDRNVERRIPTQRGVTTRNMVNDRATPMPPRLIPNGRAMWGNINDTPEGFVVATTPTPR